MSVDKRSLPGAFGELAKDHPEIANRIDRFDRESRSILKQHHDDVMDDSENGIWMVIAMIVAFSIAAAWLAASGDLKRGQRRPRVMPSPAHDKREDTTWEDRSSPR